MQYDSEDTRSLNQGLLKTTPRESSTIGGNMTRVAENLSALDEVLKILENNLESVLMPEDKGAGIDAEMDAVMARPQSPLSEQIENFADRIERRTRQIGSIIRRVNL